MKPILISRIGWLAISFGMLFAESSTANDSEASATNSPTAEASPIALKDDSRVATLAPNDIKNFYDQPAAIQHLLIAGLQLTKLDLTYKYGSDDPQNGGMDCSGTVYYLLSQAGLKNVPRDSVGMYRWVWMSDSFHAVVGTRDDAFELEKLRPGDLLFWTGTYQIERDPPVTHVMIYLGINRRTGRRVMIGASDGRTFNDKSRYGVSVFDFKLSRPGASRDDSSLTSRFIGYGPAPGL